MSTGTGTLERDATGQKRRAPIDPRIAARRRQVARDVGRRRRSRLVAFLLVLGVIAAGFGLIRSPVLDVNGFEVTSTRHVPSDEIVASSGVELGDPLVVVDAADVRSRLLALPWVADASVAVSWPNALRLVVTERVPVATLPVRDGFMLVDAEGRVLGPASVVPSDDANGPVLIEGITVPAPGETIDDQGQEALAVAAALSPGVRTRVEAVVIDPEGQVKLRLRPPATAFLGPVTDLDDKLLALQTTMAQVDLSCLKAIDLRVAGRVDLTRNPGCELPPDQTGATTAGSGAGTGGTTSGTGTVTSGKGATSSAG